MVEDLSISVPLQVVCIGGGTGLPVLLRGLKKYPITITAIVTVADDGGSSGRLRADLSMPPPGDIRNVLLALADTEPLLAQVFEHRFEAGGDLIGHTLGNLMLAAMQEITGNFTRAVQAMSRVLAVRGRVLPASEEGSVLVAEMEDGSLVTGESNIPLARKKIRRVFLRDPVPVAVGAALQAIEGADMIVLGPGSLYTSLLPPLLVPDVVKIFRSADACRVYVCNVMTQCGETDGFTVGDHVRALYDHMGGPCIDVVVANNGVPHPEVQRRYAESDQCMVSLDEDRLRPMDCRVVVDDLLLDRSYIRHDADRLSQHLVRIAMGYVTSRL
ncbi:gluconeogenesis factor YvcK family protein [Pasteuria penetrans]|uniref:gluconeogenesis factor YvcK family protein n=1 Tax=Pasteuria penetrans TaxID=86005 RepID=UPI000F91F1BE|nr:YvcK family protein [Pasteuria penetrans]